MKKTFATFGLIAGVICANSAFGVSAGTVSKSATTARISNNAYQSSTNLRGNAAVANAYTNQQKSTYFMVNQPDVDTACRTKIFECLTEYCGDVTVVPGQRESKCAYSSESELYSYALLCLQKDNSILLPQYSVTGYGTNTAAQLCPSYVQQELMSYLSMANLANQLTKSNSSLCVERRMELEAAMSCHSIALSFAGETTSMLNTYLTDYCGDGVSGGSAEMVSRFLNAGNVGADIWGWADKIVSLDLNKKGDDWKIATDAVLASYTNRMNLACGDDLQINTPQGTGQSSGQTALQAIATTAVATAFPASGSSNKANPNEGFSIWKEVNSATDIYDFATAQQVINAGLTNSAITQNSFLTSAQMDSMQTAYKLGTKVFILRDSARCYTIQVGDLTSAETSMIAQSFATCVSR